MADKKLTPKPVTKDTEATADDKATTRITKRKVQRTTLRKNSMRKAN